MAEELQLAVETIEPEPVDVKIDKLMSDEGEDLVADECLDLSKKKSMSKN